LNFDGFAMKIPLKVCEIRRRFIPVFWFVCQILLQYGFWFSLFPIFDSKFNNAVFYIDILYHSLFSFKSYLIDQYSPISQIILSMYLIHLSFLKRSKNLNFFQIFEHVYLSNLPFYTKTWLIKKIVFIKLILNDY
jgi:hypothetical protein